MSIEYPLREGRLLSIREVDTLVGEISGLNADRALNVFDFYFLSCNLRHCVRQFIDGDILRAADIDSSMEIRVH